MSRKFYFGAAMAALLSYSFNASAADDADLQDIRTQIEQLRQNYEQRIAQLEQRLKQAEVTVQQAESVAIQAQASAQQAAPSAAPSNAGAFNPAVSLILTGTYGSLRQDPAIPATGFALSANPGHEQGFNLGESELNITANIDPLYRGVATLALEAGGGIEVENAFVQSSALGKGFNFKLGRFFSGLGYLNEVHAHAWDFVDQPLVYRTLWNDQLGEDGIQLKWLAPTDTFIELGGEIGRGKDFPGTDRQNRNGNGATILFAHIGDDVGIENSWRAGASLHQTKRVDAVSEAVPDLLGTVGGVTDQFTGDSTTAGLDFVWKYSPNGNFRERYLKLQSEYFRRKQDGLLTYDTAGANIADSYSDVQSGWYLQSVYQFAPTWRTGLRYDRLDSGIASIGALNAGNVISDYAFSPSRVSWMIDYNATEFSRLRLQLARDNSRQGLIDNQIFLQYVMSLGAHGAHQY
jgi:hypothetical protein